MLTLWNVLFKVYKTGGKDKLMMDKFGHYVKSHCHGVTSVERYFGQSSRSFTHGIASAHRRVIN